MQERRRHSRARAFQAGTITYRERRASMDCVVRNLSSGGALLLVDEPQRAPCEMELLLARAGGASCRARVVWRGAAEVGVAFAPAPAAAERAPAAAGAAVVSLADVRRARSPGDEALRLAERIALVTRPAIHPRPDWVWPRLR